MEVIRAGAQRPMTRIAHLTDIHFGRITRPEIVNVVIEEVNASAVDLVVVSGDLTQRARPRQYEAAVAMLEAFTAPVMVVPGNHDVYPWWRPWLRLFRPLRRYKHYAGALMPTYERNSMAVLGINSAYGWTVKGGWIGAEGRARIASFFADRGTGVFNILVVHHNLVPVEGVGRRGVTRRGRPAFEAAAQAGVDLILSGHFHISHIEPVEVASSRRRLVLVHAGTTTSDRGRGPHHGANYYNVVAVTPERFSIEERRYDPEAQQFKPAGLTHFDRIGSSR